MKRATQKLLIAAVLPLLFTVISPNSVDAASSNARAEIVEISSKKDRDKKYTVTVKFTVTGLAKKEKLLRTICC